MPRFPSLAEEDLTDAQRAVVDALLKGPRGVVEGPFIPLLRNPGLTSRIEKVGEYLRFGGVLPKHLTELAILVVAEAWRAPFEWQAHAPLARKAGIPEAVIDSVGSGRRPDMAEAAALTVYDFVSMLLRQRAVTEPVFRRAQEELGDAGVIELIGVCGYYTLLAMVLNVAEVRASEGVNIPFAPMQAGD
jgi:4-carboxymuconolactone decarboxylase